MTEEEWEQAYKDVFGKSWSDIIDLWRVEGATPEEALEILGEELDYCDYCKTYYRTDPDYAGIYYCPYCHHIGSYSARDYDGEKDAYYEHLWETRTDH